MNYQDFIRQERRLVILRFLAETPGYRANASVLTAQVDRVGVPATRDQVDGELDWLTEQGLVEIEDLGVIRVATLTARGGDVAAGRVTVTGVKRPSPR